MNDRFEQIRLLEAVLFASAEPVSVQQLSRHFEDGLDLEPLLEELRALYANRGIHLVMVGGGWAFRTAPDLGPHMSLEEARSRKLSRVATETLAIIAYHQPITRAEIEEIRGVSISRGTLDLLLELDWVKPRGRRRTPGRPVTWGTTQAFLDQFGLETLDALPGIDELKAAGLIDTRPAINALAARGHLFDAEEVSPEPDEDEVDESLEDLLLADFGRPLNPQAKEAGPAPDETEEGESEVDEWNADAETQAEPEANESTVA